MRSQIKYWILSLSFLTTSATSFAGGVEIGSAAYKPLRDRHEQLSQPFGSLVRSLMDYNKQCFYFHNCAGLGRSLDKYMPLLTSEVGAKIASDLKTNLQPMILRAQTLLARDTDRIIQLDSFSYNQEPKALVGIQDSSVDEMVYRLKKAVYLVSSKNQMVIESMQNQPEVMLDVAQGWLREIQKIQLQTNGNSAAYDIEIQKFLLTHNSEFESFNKNLQDFNRDLGSFYELPDQKQKAQYRTLSLAEAELKGADKYGFIRKIPMSLFLEVDGQAEGIVQQRHVLPIYCDGKMDLSQDFDMSVLSKFFGSSNSLPVYIFCKVPLVGKLPIIGNMLSSKLYRPMTMEISENIKIITLNGRLEVQKRVNNNWYNPNALTRAGRYGTHEFSETVMVFPSREEILKAVDNIK